MSVTAVAGEPAERTMFRTRRARWFRWGSRHAGRLFALAVVAAIVTSAIALRGGALRPEEYLHLPYYLQDEKPVLERVFDVAHTDSGAYQARELSYFFDLLNAEAIAWGVDHGVPHFLSVCHYLFVAVTTALIWWFCRRRLRLSPLAAALVGAIFLATPMVYFGASYFPSAKAGAAMFIVACACCAAPAFNVKERGLGLSCRLGTFACAVGMGLFDRQGFFFSVLLCALLFLQAIAARNVQSFLWFSVALLSIGVLLVYNFVVGPALIKRFAGYAPSFEFQQLPISALLTESRQLLDVLLYGPLLMLDSFRFLFGCVPVAAAIGVLVAAAWWLGPLWPWPERARRAWSLSTRVALGRAVIALLPLSIAVMSGLMVLRMKAVVGLDFRRVYYGLPSVSVFTLALAVAVAALLRHRLLARRHAFAALAIVLACNLTALIEHRHIIRTGLYRDSFYRSPELLDALAHLDRAPTANIEPPYWPTFVNGETTADQDGIVRFFKRRQLLRSSGHE